MLRRLLALLGLVGCGDAGYVALEEWTVAPAVRVAITRGPQGLSATALGPTERFDATLAEGSTEVWLLGYSKATLVDRYPGFAELEPDAIAAELSPIAEPDPRTPTPDELMFVAVDADAPSALRYARRPFSDLIAAGLGVRFRVPHSAFCGGFTVERFPAPNGYRFDGLVAPDEERPLILASARPAVSTASVTLLRFEAGSFHEIARLPIRGRVTSKPALDRRRSHLWVADASRDLHRFDLDGRPLSTPPPPRSASGRDSVYEVGVGFDGNVMIIGVADDAVTGLALRSPYHLEGDRFTLALKDGMTRGTQFELLEVVGSRRAAAVALCWVSTYLDPAQASGWNIEFADIGCGQTSLPTDVKEISGDPDQFLVVGARGLVSFRNEAAHTWPQPDDPTSGSPGLALPDLNVAASLGPGRALIAGDQGTLLYRTHDGWCPLDAGTTAAFVRGARAPSLNVVYLIAEIGDRSTLVRVRL